MNVHRKTFNIFDEWKQFKKLPLSKEKYAVNRNLKYDNEKLWQLLGDYN